MSAEMRITDGIEFTSIEVLDKLRELFLVLVFGNGFRVDLSLFDKPGVEFGPLGEYTTDAVSDTF